MREWLRLHPNRFYSLSKYWKNNHPCRPIFCNNNYLLLLLLPSNLLHFVFPATLSWVCRFLQTDVRRKIVELEAKIKMPLESSHSSPAYNCFNLIQPTYYRLFTYHVISPPLPSSLVKCQTLQHNITRTSYIMAKGGHANGIILEFVPDWMVNWDSENAPSHLLGTISKKSP